VDDDGRDDASLSWTRAGLITAAILLVGVVVVVVVTNVVVTGVTGVDRHARVGLASAWFLLSLAGLAWALRRLQARHVV
jgi:hypothetical protein